MQTDVERQARLEALEAARREILERVERSNGERREAALRDLQTADNAIAAVKAGKA